MALVFPALPVDGGRILVAIYADFILSVNKVQGREDGYYQRVNTMLEYHRKYTIQVLNASLVRG